MSDFKFAASDRASLTQDLHNELYELIHENAEAATLTVAEVIGVLEILKFELMAEQFGPVDEDDE